MSRYQFGFSDDIPTFQGQVRAVVDALVAGRYSVGWEPTDDGASVYKTSRPLDCATIARIEAANVTVAAIAD